MEAFEYTVLNLLMNCYPDLRFMYQFTGDRHHFSVRVYERSDSAGFDRDHDAYSEERWIEVVAITPSLVKNLTNDGLDAVAECFRYASDSMQILFKGGVTIAPCELRDFKSYEFVRHQL